MSADDSVDSAAKPLDSKYLSGLLDNINAIQDHLSGSDGTPLLPSFLPPNAVWTAQEKDTFFHALSVHSRFRPDLISHEIRTKSVQDVCNYLSVLKLAASQEEATVSYLQWRQNLPTAMEVSSEWVAMEEEMAAVVITREQDWKRELIAEQRRAELKQLKKVSKTESHDMGPSRHKAELNQRIADTNLRTRQEDFCDSLGSLELAAIGTILREAADSSGSSQIKQSSSVLHTPPLQNSAGHARRFSSTKGADVISDVNTSVWLTRNVPTSPPIVIDAQNSQCLVQDQLDSHGVAIPSPPRKGSMAVLEELSPASRRRCQKRLYMRRRRASLSGTTAIDDNLERLKPGRKKVKRSPSPEEDTPCDPTQKRYPRAKQMAVEELRDLGLATDDLRELGIDVLNPEGVAKILGYVAYKLPII
jgi:hypothetical protein